MEEKPRLKSLRWMLITCCRGRCLEARVYGRAVVTSAARRSQLAAIVETCHPIPVAYTQARMQ